MKNGLLTIVFCALISSCNIIGGGIDVEITNNTNSEIKQVRLYLGDTIPAAIYDNIKVGKTLKFSQFNFVSHDPNNRTYWGFELESNSGDVKSIYCTDVDGSNHKRKAIINIKEDDLEVDYNGICF